MTPPQRPGRGPTRRTRRRPAERTPPRHPVSASAWRSPPREPPVAPRAAPGTPQQRSTLRHGDPEGVHQRGGVCAGQAIDLTAWYRVTDCQAIADIDRGDDKIDLEVRIADGPASWLTAERSIDVQTQGLIDSSTTSWPAAVAHHACANEHSSASWFAASPSPASNSGVTSGKGRQYRKMTSHPRRPVSHRGQVSPLPGLAPFSPAYRTGST